MFFFKKPKVNIEILGVIPDPRPIEEKQKDYQAEEIASFGLVEWKEKDIKKLRKFPIFNQNSSSSCVANSVAKILGIENYLEEGKFVRFSARDIYTRRKNKPSPGMWFQDGLRIGREGVTFEQLMPSEKLNETAMNDDSDRTPLDEIVSKPARGGNYLCLPIDIEKIASKIQEGKGVILGVRFGPKEWSREVPVILGNQTPWHHAISAVDYLLYKGKKALWIEDSWGTSSGFGGRRILTEDWFKAGRISFAGYYQFLKNGGLEEKEKPKYSFQNDLYYGMRDNEEVKILQKCLAYLRMFPSNVEYSGNFLSITLRAVQMFQLVYGIAKSSEPGFGRVGPKTRKKLNEIFS